MNSRYAPAGCAVITGGSRGIGAAVARHLADSGLPVVVSFCTDRDGAESVASEIAAKGGRCLAYQADVKDSQAVDDMFDTIESRFGGAAVVVNNAGTRADGLLATLGDEEWDEVISTNLTGALRVTRRALKPMLHNRFGRVVNVASIVGLRANVGQANYAASKAGLIGMTKTLAAEVARKGITVNAVAPGFVATNLTADVPEDVLARIPARRPGTVDEVAACIAFLASPAAGYVTGATLVVDGGMSA